ncbi:MAG: ferredoxin [Casimicrobiaceae bacterium]
MKIKLHTEFCIASGACVLECPEVFGQDDDGMVKLIDSDPAPSLHAKVRKAASVCPVTVIEIVEDDADTSKPGAG